MTDTTTPKPRRTRSRKVAGLDTATPDAPVVTGTVEDDGTVTIDKPTKQTEYVAVDGQWVPKP